MDRSLCGAARPLLRPPPPPSCPHLSFPQALGCILYLLCFGQHPFEDGAKLRIVNGKYSIPPNDTRYSVFHGLIRKSPVQGPQHAVPSGVVLPPAWPLAWQPPWCGLSRGAPSGAAPVNLRCSEWLLLMTLFHFIVALCVFIFSLASKIGNISKTEGLKGLSPR